MARKKKTKAMKNLISNLYWNIDFIRTNECNFNFITKKVVDDMKEDITSLKNLMKSSNKKHRS